MNFVGFDKVKRRDDREINFASIQVVNHSQENGSETKSISDAA